MIPKLRAWDKKRRATFAVNEVTLDAQFDSGFSKVTAYAYDEWNPSENEAPRNWVYLFDQVDDLELMWFTGLKDRNDREIYEGDIVRINHPQDYTGDFTNAIGDVF